MLAAPTKILRTTLTQQLRVILPPLNRRVNLERPAFPTPEQAAADMKDGVPNVDYELEQQQRVWKETYFVPIDGVRIGGDPIRRVQLLVPPTPAVFCDEDCYPELVGIDRVYKVAPMSPGQKIDFYLLPDQWLIAACDEGKAHTTLIVEYLR